MSRFDFAASGDAQITGSRWFPAPPEAVYDAHHDAAQVRQWMLGPPGWQMTRCEIDPRPGGAMAIDWQGDDGGLLKMRGAFRALDRPEKVVNVERFHMPDPTPDTHVETRFEPDGEGTRLRITMTLSDSATRDAMVSSGMAGGMAASYDRLEALLTG